jgi:hypothetical protein
VVSAADWREAAAPSRMARRSSDGVLMVFFFWILGCGIYKGIWYSECFAFYRARFAYIYVFFRRNMGIITHPTCMGNLLHPANHLSISVDD